ncbi:hypothetical protein GCM10027294_05170 [Marinactinospora endophytica]
MVTETESHTSGWRRRISLTTVLLPTPDGPDRTMSLFDGLVGLASFRGSTGTGFQTLNPARADRRLFVLRHRVDEGDARAVRPTSSRTAP